MHGKNPVSEAGRPRLSRRDGTGSAASGSDLIRATMWVGVDKGFFPLRETAGIGAVGRASRFRTRWLLSDPRFSS